MQIDSIQIGDYSFEINNDIELTFQRNRDNMFLSKNGYSVIVPMASANYPGIISRQNKEFLDNIMNYGVLTDRGNGIQINYKTDYVVLDIPYTKYKYQGGDVWVVTDYLKSISISQATGTTAGLITAKHNDFIYSFINKNIVVCDKDKSPVMVSNGNSPYIELYHIKHGDGMSKTTQIQLHTATPTSAGLISLEDKAKLDSLSSNIPTVLSNELLAYGDENGDGLSFRNDSDGNTYLYIPTTKLEEDGTITTQNRSAEVPVVNDSNNGLMSKEDKTKLDSLPSSPVVCKKPYSSGAISVIPHNVQGNPEASELYINYWMNGVGEVNEAIPKVDSVSPGLMTPTQKAKLDSLGTIPVYNSIEEVPSDITSKCIVTVNGTPCMMEKWSMMTDKDTAPVSTYKLEATVYMDDEEQGTGAATYISYMRYIDGQWINVYNDVVYDYFTNLRLIADAAVGLVMDLLRGKPDGIASLDSNGIIPSSQLPSYVDDVIEVYATYNKDNVGNLSNIQIYTDAAHTNSITGESGKIYINIAENEPNYQFRWTGSEFIQISAGGLVIGEIEGTAFDGKKGKELNDYVNIEKHHGVVLNGEGLGYRFGYFQNPNGALVNTVPILNADGTIIHIDKTLPVATQEKNGIMSANDKLRLNSLYNINSINILEAYDATSRQYTINLNKSVLGNIGGELSSISENLTISSATSTEAGLMSAQDKVLFDKLGIDPDGLPVMALYILFGQGWAMAESYKFEATTNAVNFSFSGFKSKPTYVPGSTEQSIDNYSKAISLPVASSTQAGIITAEDKTKLDRIPNDLFTHYVSYSTDSSTTVEQYLEFKTSSDGSVYLNVPHRNLESGGVGAYQKSIPTATSEHNGVMSKEDKVKLDNIDNIPTYASVSEVPIDVTAKQIKLSIGNEECLFTRAKNGTYIAFAGGVNSQAGNTEKLNFIVLTPHLDADNNIDSWFTTSHVSIDKAKYESLVTTINDLTNRLIALESLQSPNGGAVE